MNFPAADPQPFAAGRPTTGWSWKKTICLILLAFAAHVAFIFLLGAKKTAPPRAATNVPLLRLADNSSELVRLTDPTLFALPHAEDFGASAWPNPPAITDAAFSYTEPPSFLPLARRRSGRGVQFFHADQRRCRPPARLQAATADHRARHRHRHLPAATFHLAARRRARRARDFAPARRPGRWPWMT